MHEASEWVKSLRARVDAGELGLRLGTGLGQALAQLEEELAVGLDGVVEVIEALDTHAEPATQMRLIRMHGRKTCNREQLRMDVRWRKAIDAIAGYEDNPVLDLDLST